MSPIYKENCLLSKLFINTPSCPNPTIPERCFPMYPELPEQETAWTNSLLFQGTIEELVAFSYEEVIIGYPLTSRSGVEMVSKFFVKSTCSSMNSRKQRC
jgi:hypothetical protein